MPRILIPGESKYENKSDDLGREDKKQPLGITQLITYK